MLEYKTSEIKTPYFSFLVFPKKKKKFKNGNNFKYSSLLQVATANVEKTYSFLLIDILRLVETLVETLLTVSYLIYFL